jgi:hypothetical protein
MALYIMKLLTCTYLLAIIDAARAFEAHLVTRDSGKPARSITPMFTDNKSSLSPTRHDNVRPYRMATAAGRKYEAPDDPDIQFNLSPNIQSRIYGPENIISMPIDDGDLTAAGLDMDIKEARVSEPSKWRQLEAPMTAYPESTLRTSTLRKARPTTNIVGTDHGHDRRDILDDSIKDTTPLNFKNDMTARDGQPGSPKDVLDANDAAEDVPGPATEVGLSDRTRTTVPCASGAHPATPPFTTAFTNLDEVRCVPTLSTPASSSSKLTKRERERERADR